MNGDRQCVDCREVKPFSEFGSATRPSGSRSKRCIDCRSDRPREDRSEWMRGYRRAWLLRTKYGMSVEDYEAMLAVQDGRCLLCRQVETRRNSKTGEVQPLVVDHDHSPGGRVRGLLCCRCNRLLGMARDDASLLRRAATYLDLRPAFYEAVIEIPADLLATTPVQVVAENPEEQP